MKPVRVTTLLWMLLLVLGLGAARNGSPEEASFYYGTFPLGTATPLFVCLPVCLLSTCLDLPRSLVFLLPDWQDENPTFAWLFYKFLTGFFFF